MTEPAPAPFLRFEKGDGREIPLICGNVWKIGRGEQNTVVLIDDIVSRNHAMIQQLRGWRVLPHRHGQLQRLVP